MPIDCHRLVTSEVSLSVESSLIICLANSRKLSGHCIAGKLLQKDGFGNWIRPVSNRPHGELSAAEIRYDPPVQAVHAQTEPALLDIIEMKLLGRDNHAYQPENCLISDDTPWRFRTKATFIQARNAIDKIASDLWGVSFGSSYSGLLDRVPVCTAPSFNNSLRLIEVTDLRIRVRAEGSSFSDNRKKIRGYFHYSETEYGLMVTDPAIETQYSNRPEGTYEVGHAMLCLSLGEPFSGFAYKLIAGVILPTTTL